MTKGRLGVLRGGLAMLMMASLIGCASVDEKPLRTLRVGTPTPVNVGTAKLTAAIELGYFAEEGIEVEHISYPTTVPVMNDAAAKRIDVGGGGVFPLVMANQPDKQGHIPIKFFYNFYRKFAFEIVVPPDSPLNSISDLKGKKLGLLSLTAPYAPVTRVVLKDAGLSPEDVELKAVGENQAAFGLLMNGEIDAYETFDGNSTHYEAEGHKLKRLPYNDRINNLITYGYFAHQDMFESEPKYLIGFGRALTKGVLTCNVNPEWCVKRLWKHYPHLKPAPEAMEEEMARQVYRLRRDIKGNLAFPDGEPWRFGEYPSDAFSNLVEVLHDGGELPSAEIDTSIYYSNEFVDAINDFDVKTVEARARSLQ